MGMQYRGPGALVVAWPHDDRYAWRLRAARAWLPHDLTSTFYGTHPRRRPTS